MTIVGLPDAAVQEAREREKLSRGYRDLAKETRKMIVAKDEAQAEAEKGTFLWCTKAWIVTSLHNIAFCYSR